MYEENCSKTLLLSFYLFSEQNVFIYNFILLNLLRKQNYLRPGLTFYKQISFFEFFPDKYICCYVQWKFEKHSNFKLIKNLAVLLIHKFSTEHKELVNQQIILK